MELLIMLLFGLLVAVVWWLIQYWWVLLIIFVPMGTVALIIWLAYCHHLSKVVKAKIIAETPIIETQSVNTGHSTGWGGRYPTYYEHYENRDVITGYNVTFFVVFADGKTNEITCQKNGVVYNKLIKKI